MVDDNKVFKSFGWSTKGDPIKKGKRDAFDNEVISAYPISLDGYNKYFDIAVKGVKHLLLNTSIEEINLNKLEVKIKGEFHKFDFIISSISPDEIVGNIYGELKYMGRDLLKIVLPMKECSKDIYFIMPMKKYSQE